MTSVMPSPASVPPSRCRARVFTVPAGRRRPGTASPALDAGRPGVATRPTCRAGAPGRSIIVEEPHAGGRHSMSDVDVVCVGESMALVTPDPPAPLALGGPMRLEVAGAESTVACYLAMLGVRSAWASRVGDDPLGVLLRSRVASYGVDTSLVTVDPGAPTGVFFKDPGRRTTVWYYRSGSAASRLGA